MRCVWLVTNARSGSVTDAAMASVEAAIGNAGGKIGARSRFPEEALPTPANLRAAGIDTLVIFAGDGTINTTLAKIEGWEGAVLILPGGTMNLLAKALHGNSAAADIVAASADARPRSVPYAAIGGDRAYVGMIVGPAAHWHRPRELVRARRVRGFARAIRLAWRATFSRGIRVAGTGGPKGRHQAVVVEPRIEGLHIAAIDARRFADVARLGWDWITGDWLRAPAVVSWEDREVAFVGNRAILALVDGEPRQLAPPQRVQHGMSEPIFLATGPGSAA